LRNTLIRLTNMKSVRFGKGLFERRQIACLSQKQLATEVGVTETYLHRLEEGYVSEFEGELLIKIARSLGISMRGTPNLDDLINQFLYVPTNDRPQLI